MPKTPRAGDKIRVTVEGTTTVNWRSPSLAPGERLVILPGDEVTVEVIKPAGPTWQSGDVASCEHGFTYLRSDGGLWLNTMGNAVKGPEHPLTLIARHGKPVSSAAQA